MVRDRMSVLCSQALPALALLLVAGTVQAATNVLVEAESFEVRGGWCVDAQSVHETTLSLLHEGDAYTIHSEAHPKAGDNLLVRGHLINVEVLDLRTMQLRRAQEIAGGPDGPVEITTPMPGMGDQFGGSSVSREKAYRAPQ